MKMRLIAQLALGALCATAAQGESQKPISGDDDKSVRGSPFTKEYAKHVGELLEKWHVPGVAMGIVDGDDIWTEVGRGHCPPTGMASSLEAQCQVTQGLLSPNRAPAGP